MFINSDLHSINEAYFGKAPKLIEIERNIKAIRSKFGTSGNSLIGGAGIGGAVEQSAEWKKIRTLIEEQFASLDHEYTIMNGELMLIGYLPADEVYYGISDGSWDDLIANAEYASTNIKSALDAAGYTNVHFNISMCDNVKRQDLCYLLVRDGVTFFNVADEMQ